MNEEVLLYITFTDKDFMRPEFYRWTIIAAIIVLCGLLCVQVYWFRKAFHLQDTQFNENVNLALREVADEILKLNGKPTSSIKSVIQKADNSFFVEIDEFFLYSTLDSLVRKEFERQNILTSFNLSILDQYDSLILGSFYPQGAQSPDDPTCLTRVQTKTSMNFAVTFNDKTSSIIGAMDLWIFSAGTFALILILFGFMMINLSKQKKLAELKNDFINNMTHELQTPISNISIASEVLRNHTEIDRKKTSKYLSIIQEENLRLKHHVEQVLQMATMNRGDLVMHKQSVNIHKLLEDVIDKFRIRIDQREGILFTELKAKKQNVAGDAFHLTNIFFNLLDNADKYSPEKPEIQVTSHDDKKGIVITIQDKGVGMSRETQKSAFEKFYRAPAGNIHDVKGFGLGLAYVKNIVEAHQGFISVRTSLKEGSCFDVIIPCVS